MIPLWKLPRSSFSFGACAFSSGRPDAEQHRRQAQLLLKRRHDGNRSALAREDRLLAEAALDRAAGGLDERVVERRHPRLAAVHARDLQLDGLRRDLPHVGLEQLRDLVRILIGHEPHADLRHRDGRQDRLRAFAREPGQQAVDFERRPRPRALERRVAGLAEQLRNAEVLLVLLLVERQRRPRLPLLLLQRQHIVVEARNLDAPAAVLHLREHLRQHERRIGHRAAEGSRVQVGVAASQVDLKVHEPPEPVAHRRHAAREHPRIGNDDDVGFQVVLVGADEVVEMLAADFLFALDHELHVHGQAAVLFHVRFDRLEVHEHLALVVGRAARVDLAVADRRLEGRRLPQVERIDRLHVVVPVKQNRRRLRRAEPVAVDDRIARRLDEADVLQADAAHLVGAPLGAALHVAGVLGQRADARNRQEALSVPRDSDRDSR